MMARPVFGRHLYNQIVWPLVGASILVGLVATIVAVYFLSGLTDKWIDQVAEGATQNLESRLNANASIMQSMTKVASEDERLKSSLEAGQLQKARGLITQINVSLGFDQMMLIDEHGEVVGVTGDIGVSVGDKPLGELTLGYTDMKMSHVSFLELADRLTITAYQPVIGAGQTYTLAVSQVVDEAFLESLYGGTGDAFAIYDSDGALVASVVAQESGLDAGQRIELAAALKVSEDTIGDAVIGAQSPEVSANTLQTDTMRFRAAANQLTLEGDPSGAFGYVVSFVNQSVTDEARSTTTNLILMWSIIAVLALMGLGGWVARRVSDPLVELTEGARRLADGDFSTKIHVQGANEIAELATTFNEMTDSLKERSESLTKKVLELATLYEMSRALGATLEMDVLLESVLDSALRIFNVELGYVTLREKETGQLGLKAWRGTGTRADEEALRSSMSEWVVREGRPLIFNPTRGAANERVDSITGALAALCVPLVSNEGAVGSITVGSHDAAFRFNSDDVRLLSTIANHVTIAIGNIELFSSLQDAYLSTVRSLAAAVDAKDPFTRGHSDRVAQYSTTIAQAMGLSHDQRTALEMAAYLHDIGKIGVKEEILLKPGRLTEVEMSQMRHHPLIGANILKPVGFPWPITPVVRHHHERWDGDGYPAGLKGEEIPLLARILTVADAYEAMIADRPYRRGRTIGDAIEELERCAGSHFDAKIVEVFVEIIKRDELHADSVKPEHDDDLQPEEARAIFVALCDGMFSSFRRLGGPRLATNVEQELNAYFTEVDLPFKIANGRVSAAPDGDSKEVSVDQMRLALRRIDATMGRMSGHTLVDHFYADALGGLSERMRRIATRLEFYIS